MFCQRSCIENNVFNGLTSVYFFRGKIVNILRGFEQSAFQCLINQKVKLGKKALKL